MARESKAARLRRVHSEALREFDEIQSVMWPERMQCLQDRRFCTISGGQWEGNLGEQFENKTKFEVNKVHLAVIRIINEQRNNSITVDFVSKDGSKNDQLADVCDGLYRADEQDSVASEAYDNAFEEAVTGGFGAWRLRTEYENEDDDEDDRQRVRIEPIFDADSTVFFDLNAKRQDKSDAKRAFVLTGYTKSSYLTEWNDDPASWPKDVEQTEFDWSSPDIVYVAEYYRVEKSPESEYHFTGITGEEKVYTDADFDADESLLETLTATGFVQTKERNIKRDRVRKYILSGGGVLEDCGFIAGRCIPIVPVYGKRWFVDGVERCMGHVRLAKDVQRLKNMQLSKLGELSALSSTGKPIFTPEQMAGHAGMWADDNIKNYPYLLVNPITDAAGSAIATGPIGHTKPPDIPPAIAALLQLTEQDMSDVLGNQQAGEDIVANTSGKAVELVQNALSMQAFIYTSNFAKAMERCGAIWLSMMKDIAVEDGRKMKMVNAGGEVEQVELMRPVVGEDGQTVYENDLSAATFDVVSDVGPSSSSRRAATVRALTGMMQLTADPETQQVLSSLALMNIEGEGISDTRDFFRQKLIRIGAIKPTKQEAEKLSEEAANMPPDANQQYLEAAANEANAKAQKAQAETGLTLAKIEQARADTAKVIADMDIDQQKQILAIIDKLAESQSQ